MLRRSIWFASVAVLSLASVSAHDEKAGKSLTLRFNDDGSVTVHNESKGGEARGRDAVAQYVYTVADDFIVEVYYNGERVPDERRHLQFERFGATGERIDTPVHKGDWLVFNVVNQPDALGRRVLLCGGGDQGR